MRWRGPLGWPPPRSRLICAEASSTSDKELEANGRKRKWRMTANRDPDGPRLTRPLDELFDMALARGAELRRRRHIRFAVLSANIPLIVVLTGVLVFASPSTKPASTRIQVAGVVGGTTNATPAESVASAQRSLDIHTSPSPAPILAPRQTTTILPSPTPRPSSS